MSVSEEELKAVEGKWVGQITWCKRMPPKGEHCFCRAEGYLTRKDSIVFISQDDPRHTSWWENCHPEGILVDDIYWIDEYYGREEEKDE